MSRPCSARAGTCSCHHRVSSVWLRHCRRVSLQYVNDDAGVIKRWLCRTMIKQSCRCCEFAMTFVENFDLSTAKICSCREHITWIDRSLYSVARPHTILLVWASAFDFQITRSSVLYRLYGRTKTSLSFKLIFSVLFVVALKCSSLNDCNAQSLALYDFLQHSSIVVRIW